MDYESFVNRDPQHTPLLSGRGRRSSASGRGASEPRAPCKAGGSELGAGVYMHRAPVDAVIWCPLETGYEGAAIRFSLSDYRGDSNRATPGRTATSLLSTNY